MCFHKFLLCAVIRVGRMKPVGVYVMFRKYMIVSLAACLLIVSMGCTSKTASDESADVEEISDSGDESLETADAVENNGDLAMEDTSGDAIADLGEGDGLSADEALPAEDAPAEGTVAQTDDMSGLSDLTETPPETPAATTEPMDTSTGDLAANSPPEPDNSYAAATPEPMAEPAPESPSEPMAEAPVDHSMDAPAETAAPQSFSLKKINSQPYRHGKILVNAVYIARAGDTVEGISQKVLGSPDHVKDICKINAYNCSRGIKVGDKYYYNSPQRPTDDTTVKTFYEDAGVAPQMYTAKEGDNIRKLGKELLGHDRGWMELWATNDVESKGEIDAGIQLRYWPSSEVSAPAMASAEETPPPPMEEATPPPPMEEAPQQAANEMPSPPPQEMAAAELPPPPDQNLDNAAAAGSIEPPPPPPPPPPMDQAQGNGDHGDTSMEGAQDANQTMALGVGAILLLAAAALFISIRKKRARRHIDFNTSTQTQIE